MVRSITDNSFKQEVLEHPGIVIVDFWAQWCGPCMALGPIVDNLAEKYKSDDDIKVCKLDIDENPSTAGTYQVLSIPTIKIFKRGLVVKTIIGLKTQEDLEKEIEEIKQLK